MNDSFPDLRSFLERLRRDDAIVTVEAPVDRHLEVAEIHRRVIAAGGPALLFTNVIGSRPSTGSGRAGAAESRIPNPESRPRYCGQHAADGRRLRRFRSRSSVYRSSVERTMRLTEK